jgi:hypothetical protein
MPAISIHGKEDCCSVTIFLLSFCRIPVQTWKKGLELHQRQIAVSNTLAIMAPRPGLEPGTNGLTVRCSTN